MTFFGCLIVYKELFKSEFVDISLVLCKKSWGRIGLKDYASDGLEEIIVIVMNVILSKLTSKKSFLNGLGQQLKSLVRMSSTSCVKPPVILVVGNEDKGGVRKIKMEIFNGICH